MASPHPLSRNASPDREDLPTQCTARSKHTGNRCGRPTVPGAVVCRYHGGAAPQVQRRAALRLLELVDPAIATLATEMATAEKSGDRQRAANSILDRAGVPRRLDVADAESAKALLIEKLIALREQQEAEHPIVQSNVVNIHEGE